MSVMGEHLAICLLAEDGRVRYREAAFADALGVRVEVGDRLVGLVPWLRDLSVERPATFMDGHGLGLALTPTGLPGVAAVARIYRLAGELERDLRDARRTLASILDAAPISILVLDMDKKVTMWNAAATRLFGWTSDEILGSTYPLVPQTEWQAFEELFDRVVAGEGFTGVEARRERKDGSSIDLRVHTAPMRDAEGVVTSAMAILEDLSEQRRLEARVQHSQKMEAIGRLAGGIAHDFNNLLTVILGTSEMLMARDLLSPRVSKGLREINECGDRARSLTAQLLAFSRRQVMHPEIVDMSEQVRTTASLISRLIGEQIVMKLDLSPNPLLVRVDTGHFDQVLINLAVNARDAMKDGGTLFVATRLSRDADGAHATLEIRDTGPGMAADVLPHIFDPFFTTKHEGRGTGLGLATVHGVVEQSGGDISVENVEGEGVTFRVRLPLLAMSPRVEPSMPTKPPRPPKGDEAVLLVEDDPQVRSVASSMLRRLGYDVTTACDGQDALFHFAKGLDVALVITDLTMPRMGGRALSAKLRITRPDLPFIFVSANLDDEDLHLDISSGRARFLQKPFNLAALAREVRSALD